MNLEDYLVSHQIVGVKTEKKDIIVDNPFEFVNEIRNMNYCITKIFWWEHLEVSNSVNSIGHGGPQDPRNRKYYFSKIGLSKKFSCDCSSDQIKDYLRSVYQEYSKYCLYPSFSVREIRVK